MIPISYMHMGAKQDIIFYYNFIRATYYRVVAN